MRILGPAIVVLALLLSTGGVAYRTNAEPGTASPAVGVTPVDPPVPAAPDEAACQEQKPRALERVEIDVTERAARSGAVTLNTRGYNYRDPDAKPGELPKRPGDEAAKPKP